MQPVARLRGRIRFGLTPWRRRGVAGFLFPVPCTTKVWSEEWRAPDAWLGDVEAGLREHGAVVLRGGDFDRWDLEVRGGLFGGARLLMAIEEHRAGKQLVRFGLVPNVSGVFVVIGIVLILLTIGASLQTAWIAATVLTLVTAVVVGRVLMECGRSCATLANTSGSMVREEWRL